MHAARFAWHNDDPDYDGLAALRRLNLAHVRTAGHANLRCVWTLGLSRGDPAAPRMQRGTIGMFPVRYICLCRKVTIKEVYKQEFGELMPGVEVPGQVGVSCCSQFAVSCKAVRARPREDYVRWRQWLLETPLGDDLSGRVFEYLWHSGYPVLWRGFDCWGVLLTICGV